MQTNMLKHTYLVELFRSDKLLFVLVILFIAGQVFFTWKGVETFPFLNYGMYSGKAGNADTVEVIALRIDNKPACITCLSDVQGAMVQGSFTWYNAMVQHGYSDSTQKVFDKRFAQRLSPENYRLLASRILNDSTQIKRFPAWLFQYIADMRLIENPVMEAHIVTAKYNPNFLLDTVQSKVVIDGAAGF
ncbi:MAG: hypothetical protein KF872_00300 [Chitinophagales bacterium]|nr:hypothetical protein [Chitinophagales bacterium]